MHRISNELLSFCTLKKLVPLIAVLLFTSLSPFKEYISEEDHHCV